MATLMETPTLPPASVESSADLPSPPETRNPRWTRPALITLLAGTALLYLWDLGASGNANSFYAAAVQAGSESWKSWFFGSIDTSNFITVDKPPASLWVMGLSARIFGYSSWSLLAPQAIEGVLAVWLLFSTVRRVAGARAGLLAGAVLALTPAAALMFRFDNPDAFLLLLVVAATYCVTRAIERAGARWFVLAGVALGFAFLTKSAQALLVVPPLGLAYVVAAPSSVWRRVRTLALGVVAMVASAGWWFAAVSLWPASDRPYIGGSTDNNPLELAFGYNGLARLFGGSGNGGGGGGTGGGGNTQFGGATGLGRMFTGEFALEISWLLPAALLAIVALFVLAGKAARTDRLRAAAIIWGGSLLVTGLTFSFMQGTIHPYYSVALAPSIGALVGLGVDRLWHRGGLLAVVGLMLMTGVTAVWGLTLLRRESGPTWVEALVLLGAVAALVAVLWRFTGRHAGRRGLAALALATVMAVGAPAATWAVETAGTPHSGSIPTAVSSSSSGGGFGGGGSSSTSSALVTALQATTTKWSVATVGAQSAASLELDSDTAVMAIGGFTGSDPSITLTQFKALVASGDLTYFVAGGGAGGGGGGGGFGGGGFGGGTAPGGTTTGTAPTGTAPTGTASTGTAPTGGGTGGPGGGSSGSAAEITSWVEANFTATTIGGTTVYDLTT